MTTRYRYFRRWQKLAFRHLSFHLTALFVVGVAVCLILVAFAIFPSDSPNPSPLVLPASTSAALAPPPAISAQHTIVLDLSTEEILFSLNADIPVAPASTTKLMTALVAHAHFPSEVEITVSESFSQGQDIGLVPGERLTSGQLLYALLVQSGNDAAETLASAYPGGRPAFISAMNTTAHQLRLHHTVFKNPTGLDEAGHVSTAADLARLALSVLKVPLLSRIVSSETALIPATNHPRVLTNTNELLGRVPGVLGMKTGFTDAAGEALVTLVDRAGRRLLIVVLKSTDRFADTEALINWAYP
jgi:D-alanyl-D-alanine carboxypeptidase